MITDSQFVTRSVQESIRSRKEISLRQFIEGKKLFFAGKRVMDIVISTMVILLLLSWLTPLLGLLIKLSSRGPVFFRQKRVGRYGRSFTCIKFRTMIVNEDADRRQATADDRRITRLGRFLRNSNIDEIPQFFNVWLGDMSIVGPRPHMHADCRHFSTLVPRYKIRTLVKPGITGLSQVKGYHGYVISYECIFNRYQWDVFYVRNASFRRDCWIMISTAWQRAAYMLGIVAGKRKEKNTAVSQTI